MGLKNSKTWDKGEDFLRDAVESAQTAGNYIVDKAVVGRDGPAVSGEMARIARLAESRLRTLLQDAGHGKAPSTYEVAMFEVLNAHVKALLATTVLLSVCRGWETKCGKVDADGIHRICRVLGKGLVHCAELGLPPQADQPLARMISEVKDECKGQHEGRIPCVSHLVSSIRKELEELQKDATNQTRTLLQQLYKAQAVPSWVLQRNEQRKRQRDELSDQEFLERRRRMRARSQREDDDSSLLPGPGVPI